jgi:hypothetical protein
MADADSKFRDLAHVREWLQHFRKPEVATSLDYGSVQMLAILGQAVEVIAAEVAELKSVSGRPDSARGA